MRRVVALVVVFSAAAAGTAFAAVAARPALRVVEASPLVVRGTGFHARERTRVTLYAEQTKTEVVTATAAGTFRVSFGDVPLSRCDGFRIVAVGRAGSRARLVRPPLPECNPN